MVGWPKTRTTVLGVVAFAAILYVVYSHGLNAGSHLFSAFGVQQSHQQPDANARTFTRHIVAVGDLHGDLPNANRVLRFSSVVDDFGDWSGEVDFLVQTGDIIDRGDDTIKLFTTMEKLRAQALSHGAVVLSHLGNHEWMNAIGDWRYVYPSEIETFGSVKTRQNMISTGPIGRAWAQNYTTTSRLPLHPSIGPPNSDYTGDDGPLSRSALSFVHGGLSPNYPQLVPFPSRINEISTTLLRKLQHREQPPPYPPNPYPGLPLGTTDEEKAMYDANGPVWYRGWALDDDETVCRDVNVVLAKTGTRRMIMGHTPDFHGIVSRCGGKIIIIDTGISHAYGGVLSALSIHYTLTPIDGEVNRWVEREVVSALYEERREILVDESREVVGDFRRCMYPRIEPYQSGRLQVSELHSLYYELCGNKNGSPVVFLHGGPGGGIDDQDRSFFNPKKYKIILFDQRGAGSSTPLACIEENTTWDLVKDIEKLRELLKIEKWHVFGGSWGSTLALVYAQAHPDRVKSLVLRGVFTLRKSELNFFYQDGASHLFPEAWEEYLAPIPEAERSDMILSYHRQLNSADDETRLKASKAWSKWEMHTSKLYVDPLHVARADQDDFAHAFARIENHYFMNAGFMRDGQLLEVQEIDKIRHIPTIVVQGRYDVVCPATTAYALKKVWPEITLHIVPDAGHSSRESGIAKLLVEATDRFADL